MFYKVMAIPTLFILSEIWVKENVTIIQAMEIKFPRYIKLDRINLKLYGWH
jgi:hypothetical protein